METIEMYSPTHCRTVTLTFGQCPRCKGFGRTITDAMKDKDCICEGNGELWHDEQSGCYSNDKEEISIY